MKQRIVLTALVDVSRWLIYGKAPWWAFWKRDRRPVDPIQTATLALDLDPNDENDRAIVDALSALADKKVLPALYEQFGELVSLDLADFGPVNDVAYIDTARYIVDNVNRRAFVTEREKRLERLLRVALAELPIDTEGELLRAEIREELNL